jgi:type IV fimbrial biogenesis protein FimT
MKAHHSLSAGFTLIEMAITLSIVGVLLALSVPSFRQTIVNQGIRTASFDLFSALEFTRSEAIKQNGAVVLRAGATTDGAWTTGWRAVDASNAVLRTWAPISNITVTPTPSTATAITFGTSGRVTGTAPKLQIDPTTSMSGVEPRCIQVDLSGRARAQLGGCP